MSRPPFQRASGQQQGRGEGYRSYDPSQAEPSGRPDEAGAGTVYDEQGYPVDPALYEQQQRRYHEERQQQYGRASHDVEMVEPPMARAAPLAPPPMVRPHSWTGHQPEQMYGQRPGNVETHRSQSVWPESAPHPPGFVQQPSPSAHSGTSASASTTSSAGRGTFPVPRRRSRAGSRAAQHLFAPISTVLSTGRGGQPSIGSAPPSMQAFASGSDTGNVAYSGLTAGVSSSSVSPVGLGPRTAGAVSGPADGGMRQGSERFRQALDGFSRVKDGRRYKLVVVQNPSRARMCGFGDKDRRPLSPTLIVKLVITDEATGRELHPSEVNSSLFFLASDLCHPDDLMATPFNILVHHHPATTLPGPAATQQLQHYEAPQVDPSSYGTPLPRGLPSGEPIAGGSGSVFRPQIEQMGAPEGGYGGVRQDQLPPLSSLDLPSTSSRATTSQHPDMGRRIQPPEIGGGSHQHAQHPYYAQVAGSSSMGLPGGGGGPSLTAVASESYTRNLVGSSVASASVLYDEQNQPGIFFTLQDISVRTEGVYRIKLMFANLGLDGRVNTGVSEALAETFTEPFTVYSPRRFPGMLDPTELSRKFASQGIKIPVRNDKKKRKQGQEEGGAPDDGDDDD